MRRQRNMAQMKEQIKIPEKELNKMKISNLPDAEFKTLVIRMFKELNKDLNSIKQIQSELKNTLIEIKNNLQGNNSRVEEAENQMIWNIRKKKTTTKKPNSKTKAKKPLKNNNSNNNNNKKDPGRN